MPQRAVAGRGATRARRLDDLQHHRLAVVAHRHLHAAQTLRRRRARRAATVPRSGKTLQYLAVIGTVTIYERWHYKRFDACLARSVHTCISILNESLPVPRAINLNTLAKRS